MGYMIAGKVPYFLDVLGDAELRLLLAIAHHVKDEDDESKGHKRGELTASMATVAKYVDRSERHVRTVLPRLVALGLLDELDPPRQGRAGRYRLSFASHAHADLKRRAQLRALTAESPRVHSAKSPRAITTETSRDHDRNLASWTRQGEREEIQEETPAASAEPSEDARPAPPTPTVTKNDGETWTQALRRTHTMRSREVTS